MLNNKLWMSGAGIVLLGSVAQLLCMAALRFSLSPILGCLVSLLSIAVTMGSVIYIRNRLLMQFLELKLRCIARLQGNCPEEKMEGEDQFAELDAILSLAQREWRGSIQRDYSLFENLAVEAERKRVAGDIDRLIRPHFVVISTLASESSDPMLSGEVFERLTLIETGVDGVLTELHADLLAEADLVSSICSLVDRFKRASRIETSFASEVEKVHDAISLDAKFAIYRVTQESLNNIEKHSGATRARVVLSQQGDELIVLIEDNGRGFQERRSTQSRGLKNIKERAAAIGARVSWEKSRAFDKGTLVTISLRPGAIAEHQATVLHRNKVCLEQRLSKTVLESCNPGTRA